MGLRKQTPDLYRVHGRLVSMKLRDVGPSEHTESEPPKAPEEQGVDDEMHEDGTTRRRQEEHVVDKRLRGRIGYANAIFYT
uniref:Uncharacterized protein n=1 Tax=Panagrellus redivivus TaxID=6233 RepID=A0A7E4VP18_PANRE